jgi:hypothetical protein
MDLKDIDKFLQEAKNNLDEPDAAVADLGIQHSTSINLLLEENYKDELILQGKGEEYFVIDRKEHYACVTGRPVTYHYFFDKRFKEYKVVLS